MNIWEVMLAVFIGVSLSAACGFRVFVPLLVMSVASRAGHLALSPAFAWIASYPAMIAFAVATALEIAAYYVPWLDNLLDTIATPAAGVAGVIVTAACVTGMSPLLRWTLAVIAGGGAALAVQAVTVMTRAASSGFTGGMGNAAVSTGEAIASVGLSFFALVAPVLAFLLVIVSLYCLLRKAMTWRARTRGAQPARAGADAGAGRESAAPPR